MPEELETPAAFVAVVLRSFVTSAEATSFSSLLNLFEIYVAIDAIA
jgi:hypothetical protein